MLNGNKNNILLVIVETGETPESGSWTSGSSDEDLLESDKSKLRRHNARRFFKVLLFLLLGHRTGLLIKSCVLIGYAARDVIAIVLL